MAAEPAATGEAAAGLWDDIVRVYERAESSGACSKTETQVDVWWDAAMGVEFVLRVATALKAKPQGPQAAERRASTPAEVTAGAAGASAPPPPPPPPPTWRNPFLPPEPDLFVRHLGPAHSLVLNKFNVVRHHTIVITREFRSQAEPLYGGDLAATLEVVEAMPGGGLAFYNCGPNSGRSQPHKHLQVVPLPFKEGAAPLAPVHGLVEAVAAATAAAGAASGGRAAPLQALELRQLPYRCYAALLPESPSPEQLESAFNSLLQLAHPGYTYVPPVQLDGPPTDAASAAAAAAGSVSYNVLLTRQWLMLVPRRAERFGPLAPNSLAFAGTMLVRSEEELEFVRQAGPSGILAQVGEPW
ncbi:hypothetical protein GPECTOR_2g1592 [Gonium pectorale]|uniref:Uncharacterized protein n=1 Tax=Gonium pectorale TaxID=33097 RepID=A0A150H394_GONPE|nr:hypothetical protein GPECTOR_2g1592 [Gonium pectorale]|eukprot:KXZ56040.1 hypothetical protein GPECTOR_2g1592 [Gonium pectorale]